MNIFLVTLTKPFRTQSKFYLSVEGKESVVADLDSYLQLDDYTLVTFELDRLAGVLREKSKMLPNHLVDLEQFAKQVDGRSSNEFGWQKPWDVWNLVLNEYANDDRPELKVVQDVYYGMVKEVDVPQIDAFFCRFVKAIASTHERLLQEAVTKDEFKRFTTIEMPIVEILAKRTHLGIRIDPVIVKQKLEKLTQDLYITQNKLQLDFGIISPKDYKRIYRALRDEHFYIVANSIDSIDEDDSYFDLLKLGVEKSALVELLYNEMKISRNRTTLLRIGELGTHRVYPVFESFGSVTGRILVRAPALQQLSRIHRDVLIPDDGKTFTYIDYRQFEAGILASECDDADLISGYNDGNIYEDLSHAMFATIANAEFCKKLFFRYTYGASALGIGQFIKEFAPRNVSGDYDGKINSFFQKFKKLDEFRKSLTSELKTNGRVGSQMGNFRGQTDGRDAWVTSQRIQGTASLILKRSIIEIYKSDPEIEFVLPMHDAVLYQVPSESAIAKNYLIQKSFEKNFELTCPKIKAKAEFKFFSQIQIPGENLVGG